MQLGTVRTVGRFLEDPLDVPWAAVEFLAARLGIADASCVKKYVGRTETPYEHAWEMRERFSCRSFDDAESAANFARFLDGLRGKGFSVRDEDVARLAPLGHAHLNCLGRYAFATRAVDGLRPLRDPGARDDSDDEP